MKFKILSITELRAKKDADISTYISDVQKNIVELNHEVSTGKTNKMHQVRNLKKSIAKAKTVQTELAQRKEK